MVRDQRQEHGFCRERSARLVVPGEKNSRMGKVNLAMAKNAKWGGKLGDGHLLHACHRWRAGLRRRPSRAIRALLCLRRTNAEILGSGRRPAKSSPTGSTVGIGIAIYPRMLGVCSSPLVDGERVYSVTHDFKVFAWMSPEMPAAARRKQFGNTICGAVWRSSSDAATARRILDGDLLYVHTSNGIDARGDSYRANFRNSRASTRRSPLSWTRLRDARRRRTTLPIAGPHVAWPVVFAVAGNNGRKLVFFGGGDGRCYAFQVLQDPLLRAAKLLKLQVAWSFDCNPPEYKNFGGLDGPRITATGRQAEEPTARTRRMTARSRA